MESGTVNLLDYCPYLFDGVQAPVNQPWGYMVLAQRQKYRSMEQNRKPRDKSTHIWTPYL